MFGKLGKKNSVKKGVTLSITKEVVVGWLGEMSLEEKLLGAEMVEKVVPPFIVLVHIKITTDIEGSLRIDFG